MRSIYALLSVSILFTFSTPQVLAAQPGGHLNIEEVIVIIGDIDTTLVINGYDFDFGSPLEITLAGVPVTILSATDMSINVTVPTSQFAAGDYLLTVSAGNGQSQNDEYDLTIGAAGPAGKDGADGATGDVGPPGASGADGKDGADGAGGATGDVGPPGSGGNDGADGSPGMDGAAGADGAPGSPGAAGPPGADGADGQDATNVTADLCLLYQLTDNAPPATLACVFGQCAVDSQCSDGSWCRLSDVVGLERECVPFQQEGEFCGGVTTESGIQRCAPDHVCEDQTPMIADDPGICVNPATACTPDNFEPNDDADHAYNLGAFADTAGGGGGNQGRDPLTWLHCNSDLSYIAFSEPDPFPQDPEDPIPNHPLQDVADDTTEFFVQVVRTALLPPSCDSYDLNVSFGPVGFAELVNVTGNISSIGDTDWYRFTAVDTAEGTDLDSWRTEIRLVGPSSYQFGMNIYAGPPNVGFPVCSTGL